MHETLSLILVFDYFLIICNATNLANLANLANMAKIVEYLRLFQSNV